MHRVNNIISLTVGDWSHDGHNQTDRIVIDCNRNKIQIENAYKAGVKIVGFDLSKTVASEYEDYRIRDDELKKLRAAGYTDELDDEYPESRGGDPELDGTAALSPSSFVEIYLWIAKQGDQGFTYTIVDDIDNNIDVGGYGLFS